MNNIFFPLKWSEMFMTNNQIWQIQTVLFVTERLKSSKSPVSASSSGSRWTSIVNSIAKQVSQVSIPLRRSSMIKC